MAGNAVVILCTIFIPLTITVIAYGSSTIFILRLREHTYSMSAKTYRMHIRIIVLVLLQVFYCLKF
jgi:hypothetical protein